MKDEMGAFDILSVTVEMQSLVGGYLDKVFHWDSRNVLLRINIQGVGKKELVLQDMKWLYLSPERPETPDLPSQFAVNLRKYIANSRVNSVQMREFDRIVVLELERNGKFQLIIELFGDGNIILVSEGKILNSLLSRKWKSREVKPGLDYSFPSSRFNPLTMDEASFRKTMLNSNTDVVRTLATTVNIGGQYAEEVCLRTNVEKGSKAKELSEADIHAMFDVLTLLLKSARTDIRPREIIENGEAIDVTPIPLLQYANKDIKERPTMSDALYGYITSKHEVAPSEDPEAKRLHRQLEQQKKAIAETEIEAKRFSELAESLYVDYVGVEILLKKVGDAVSGKDWTEAKNSVTNIASVKEIDPKTHSFVATIQGNDVTLDYTMGVDGNVNSLYSQAKEAKNKTDGAKVALTETQKKLSKVIKEGEAKKLSQKKGAKKTKEFWFERYKWFITSKGRMVLAGRDVHTNDQLVKKHLKATERFAHADVHGAPSVVVVNGVEATDEEMTETCTFALSHSKAWMAGATEGTAYWVLPDQVSKMAQAGEFVPRGAFIIRGKRNYIYHIPSGASDR